MVFKCLRLSLYVWFLNDFILDNTNTPSICSYPGPLSNFRTYCGLPPLPQVKKFAHPCSTHIYTHTLVLVMGHWPELANVAAITAPFSQSTSHRTKLQNKSMHYHASNTIPHLQHYVSSPTLYQHACTYTCNVLSSDGHKIVHLYQKCMLY